MGAMAVVLMAGVSVKTLRRKTCSIRLKSAAPYAWASKAPTLPLVSRGMTAKLTGFEVEFANELAKHLGVKADLKPTKWDGMLASLDSKRIDVVINQVTISEERKKKYRFLHPIYRLRRAGAGEEGLTKA
ncbi:cystine ABC transporter [Klebsiella pneumoniae]|uniref:Cystine ABC transporter n=1 Tax=Klebsiella pneumoniae TaxID=573 RepID=A0A378AWG0_KLEPN|nr:cystine ABC transporter [Klebsiella pneumoniae]